MKLSSPPSPDTRLRGACLERSGPSWGHFFLMQLTEKQRKTGLSEFTLQISEKYQLHHRALRFDGGKVWCLLSTSFYQFSECWAFTLASKIRSSSNKACGEASMQCISRSQVILGLRLKPDSREHSVLTSRIYRCEWAQCLLPLLKGNQCSLHTYSEEKGNRETINNKRLGFSASAEIRHLNSSANHNTTQYGFI